MANIAQTVNVLQAMILTDGDALVLTPTYHVFEMNKGHQDASTVGRPPRVTEEPAPGGRRSSLTRCSASSASTKDGSVLISFTNLDAEEPAAGGQSTCAAPPSTSGPRVS